MQSLLNPRTLMALEYENFEAQTAGCEKIFEYWTAQFDSFVAECRLLMKQRAEDGGDGKSKSHVIIPVCATSGVVWNLCCV